MPPRSSLWPYAAGLVLFWLGLHVGIGFPDVDQRWPYLMHRSFLTHGLLLPLLLFVLARRYWKTPANPLLRLFVIGLCLTSTLHLCFDLFPRSWRGFALIWVPFYGRTDALFFLGVDCPQLRHVPLSGASAGRTRLGNAVERGGFGRHLHAASGWRSRWFGGPGPAGGDGHRHRFAFARWNDGAAAAIQARHEPVMSELTIDYQLASQTCDHCKAQFDVSRGRVYNDGKPAGLYLAAMHGCRSRLVFLAVALRENLNLNFPFVCFLLKVRLAPTEIQMTVTDPEESPWASESYVGSMLTRETALSHPLIKTVFEVADQITMRDPVHGYLDK